MGKLIDKINAGREVRAYNKYLKLNIRRKAKEAEMFIFRKLDDVRRRIGFVK